MSGLQTDEVQTILCKARPNSQGNHFRIKFKDRITKKISQSASAEEVARAINELDSIEGVTVAVENVGPNSRTPRTNDLSRGLKRPPQDL